MTEIYEFPAFPISKQVFHVPGAAIEGGLTSGGARIISPEPGGFSMLQIQPSLQTGEWIEPLSSWLMSKTNGEVLRVRLAPTPQIAWSARRSDDFTNTPWNNGVLWAGAVKWSGDISLTYTASASVGSNVLSVDMTGVGEIFRPGHVIGHRDYTYKIDTVRYSGNIATMRVKPSLRSNVTVGDAAYLRPWFLGRIMNPSDVITTYDAENNGNIQIGKMMLAEAIV